VEVKRKEKLSEKEKSKLKKEKPIFEKSNG
jgi:hypothetical protein